MELIELDPFDPIGEYAIQKMIDNCITSIYFNPRKEAENKYKEVVMAVLRRIQNIRATSFLFEKTPENIDGNIIDRLIYVTYYPYVKQQVGIAIIDKSLVGEH